MVNHRRLAVVLPPIFAAIFIGWGCAISWAPNWRGAHLWQLNDLDWVLGFIAVAAVVLLALALEREHRKKLGLAARTKRMERALTIGCDELMARVAWILRNNPRALRGAH